MRLRAALIATLSLSLGLAAGAVRARPPSPPPTALPGDRMPPSNPWAPKPATSAKPTPPPEAQSTAPGPTLDAAASAARAALAACAAKGFKVGVAVVDTSGQPRAIMVADGAFGGHGYTGVRKALMALAYREPTSQAAAQAVADPAARAKVTPAMMPWAGAVPLWAKGDIIGGIGVSGASSLQDESCAAAGAAAINASR